MKDQFVTFYSPILDRDRMVKEVRSMKWQNLNKKSYEGVVKVIKDINARLYAKIKKENDKVISNFNYTMLEIMNKIFK
jgi:hypothetical protein